MEAKAEKSPTRSFTLRAADPWSSAEMKGTVAILGRLVSKADILNKFRPLFAGTGGIDSWLSERAPDAIFARLDALPACPLTQASLNQLLTFNHEAAVSSGFFRYYWLTVPAEHPYDVARLQGFNPRWIPAEAITSLDHLQWGIYRLYLDALLFFGNVRMAFRTLRELDEEELRHFFKPKRMDPQAMVARGDPAFPLEDIAKDSRYLIAEMACKTYGESADSSDLQAALTGAYLKAARAGGKRVTIKALLDDVGEEYTSKQRELRFSADEILEEEIASESDISEKVARMFARFSDARDKALKNTRFYLSLVNDLDVYVATSMRQREDFRNMTDFCDVVFGHADLRPLHVRYFDPTLSAAAGHEDKGLIECLMVKCAKVLVYCAGSGDTWGKDAEAAMALSLGKPVIFYCDAAVRTRIFRDVHPLTRLIDFETGLAVGAIVASTPEEVSTLLYRIFNNQMEYEIEQPRAGYLRVKECLTGSCIRLQTSDEFLRETFWNYYHGRRPDIRATTTLPRR